MEGPTRGLCRECAPASALLDPDERIRWEALARATRPDRPKVMLAAVRGGRLWSRQGPDGEDAGAALLRWLLGHGCTALFARYVAEDAVHGPLAWPVLACDEPTRSLQRAPEWLAAGGNPNALVGTWWGRVDLLAALAFRVGGARVNRRVVGRTLAAYRFYDRWWARAAVAAGRMRPTPGTWCPPEPVFEAAPSRRRWPIERIEAGGVAVCGFCGEALPARGACRWCGRDAPDDVCLVAHTEFFKVRALCPRCGVDLCHCAPVVCPGCGLDLVGQRAPRAAAG